MRGHRQDVSHANLGTALAPVAINEVSGDNGGVGVTMWGTVVNRDGVVCAVVLT